MIDSGIFNGSIWLKEPVEVVIGTNVNGFNLDLWCYGCDTLQKLTIPSTIERSLDNTDCFSNIPENTEVHYMGTIEQFNDVFYNAIDEFSNFPVLCTNGTVYISLSGG